MPAMTKRGLLRRTRELLNSNGLHWGQGDFSLMKWIEEKQKEVQAFCTAGGLQQILYGDAHYTPAPSEETYPLFVETVGDIVAVIGRRHGDKYDSSYAGTSDLQTKLDVIFRWNDAEETTWEEVNAVLAEAALDKAKRATLPTPPPAI